MTNKQYSTTAALNVTTLSSYFRLNNVTPNCLSGTRCPTPLASSFLGPSPSRPVRAATVLYEATGDTLFLVSPATHWMSILRMLLIGWSVVGLHAITFIITIK